MNSDKSQYSDHSGSQERQNIIDALERTKNQKAPYTYEITRVHKKQVAREGRRFLILTINVNGRSFQSFKQVPTKALADEEVFKMTCSIGFNEMKDQLKKQGIDTP